MSYRGLKIWIGTTTAGFPNTPPYPKYLYVTELSQFGQMVWEYPKEDFPPGRENDRFLEFCGETHFQGAKHYLSESDTLLITQLKELIVAYQFRRSVLEPDILATPKALTVKRYFKSLRRLFVGLKVMKKRSLHELDQSTFDSLMYGFDTTPIMHNSMQFDFASAFIFAREGLVTSAETLGSIDLKRALIAADSSAATGAQALTDWDLSLAVGSSVTYFDQFAEIEGVWRSYNRGSASRMEMAGVLNNLLPLTAPLNHHFIEEQIGSLIKAAGVNLLGWHLGARIHEILSAETGFIVGNDGEAQLAVDKVNLSLTTRKAVTEVHGRVRNFEVHPYLARVARVLEIVRDLEGNAGCQKIFVSVRRKGNRLNTSNTNAKLKFFAEVHGVHGEMSSHVWRNTLVSTTVRALDESLGPLCQYLGHEHVATTLGYAVTNPFVRDEMNSAIHTATSARSDRFLDGASNLHTIRGKQGETFQRRINAEQTAEKTLHAKDEMLSGRVVITSVAPGIECVKHPLARGRCAEATGLQFDTEYCHPDCAFRTETVIARESLVMEVEQIPALFASVGYSTLMKARTASDLLARLRNWPEVVPQLTEILDRTPSLWVFFEELKDA